MALRLSGLQHFNAGWRYAYSTCNTLMPDGAMLIRPATRCICRPDKAFTPPSGITISDLTCAAFAAIVLNGWHQIVLGIFRAVTGVLIIQRFDPELIGGEQVFEQLLHRHFS